MHALIIGGGIAGLTTAITLRQAGFSCDVFEAAPELKPVGAGIWLAPNALQVMDQLGQLDRLAQHGQFMKHVSITDHRYRTIQQLDTAWQHDGRPLHTLAIHRGALQQGLIEALPDTTIHTGKKLAYTETHADHVTAHFLDGTMAEGDILIGADGIHSTTRQEIAPAARIRFAGQTCWRGISNYRFEGEGQHTAKEVWGVGSRFGFSPIGPDKVYWFAVRDAQQDEILPRAKRKPFLIDHFSYFDSPVTDLIDFTPPDAIVQNDILDLLPLKTWSEGRVCLIGDAAHATTPNLGQGGCQAIEDAWFITKFLTKYRDPEEAFARFHQFRKPRVNRIVRTSWQLGKLAHFSFAPELRNLVLRLTPKFVQKRQVNRLYTLPKFPA